MPTYDWMADNLATDNDRVRHVLLLSADGLVLGRSEHMDKDAADTCAATCSGLMSLALAAARDHGTSPSGADQPAVRQVLTEYEGGFLFVRVAGDGTRLAVVAEENVDAALISYQMQALIHRLGQATLSTPARSGITDHEQRG